MNCIIYPCSNELIPFIDYIDKIDNDLHIVKAVCPVVCRSMVSDELGCDISTDFDASLEICDTVIICDYKNIGSMYKDVVKKIILSLEKNKNVICCAELHENDLKKACSLAKEKNLVFRCKNKYEFPEVADFYMKQESVVIGIGSMFSPLNTDKLYCDLIRHLNESGYKTVGIGTSNNNMLINSYTLPKEIFRSSKSNDEKVFFLNNFINDIELLKCPDIIVVQFPGGMSNFAEEVLDGYTIDAYTFSQAVSVDYFILGIPVNVVTPDHLSELDTEYKYKYNCPIDAFAVSNSVVDIDLCFDIGEVVITALDKSHALDYIEKCSDIKGYLFCDMNDSNRNALVSDFIEKCSNNVEEL
ncbi:MAG: hypothetical protein IKN66_11525 [Ruminococcus sp.]|nr:hypothetical protein [Ruminococcus sp.]